MTAQDRKPDEEEKTGMVIEALCRFAGAYKYKLTMPDDMDSIAIEEMRINFVKKELEIIGSDGDVFLAKQNGFKS